VEGFLRNMYTADIWRDTAGDMGESGRKIIAIAQRQTAQGELIMSEEEFAVFVEAFERGGFRGPVNWYCNFTRNWETTEGLSQQVSQPAMMIYGEHDLVPPNPFMAEFVPDLEEYTLPCGHWIQQECPQDTNRLLLDWLDRRMKPLFER
jgi:pimeloyl-ACP methyl ester carboxylesterase